jgi:hypothetical protein
MRRSVDLPAPLGPTMARMLELDAVKETELRSPSLALAVAGVEDDRNGRKAALARRGAGQERLVTARVYSGGGEAWYDEKDGDAESGGDDEDADVDRRSAGSSSDDRS